MKKVSLVLASLLGFSSLHALEFGTMGSQAFGMAGTGVAVSKSPWGLYYNPALMSVDSGLKFGAFVGVQTKNHNVRQILTDPLLKMSQQDLTQLNGKNPALVENLKAKLTDNSLKINNQNGLVLQLPDLFGSLSVGAFTNFEGYSKVDLKTDDLHSQGLTQGSINVSSYALLEVPLGYSYQFDTAIGDISLGVAGKYLNLTAIDIKTALNPNASAQDSLNVLFKNANTQHSSSNFGVDAGLVYTPVDLLSIGVVGKYLNAPEFAILGKTYKIDPQVRAGLALNFPIVTLALDADITANKNFNQTFETQMVSFGTSVDLAFVALRAGLATDLKHTDDIIISAGLGLAFLDFGVQFGTKTNPYNGIQLPDYLALQLGLGFSF
ncbi:hypothetical protein BBW65_05970 [Helicobacter enhydrae]|uniref:Conjugal transfer protein TraF n=1 Tax=Helicobacter enhydrae TaxID=222136 RepID=A0A1B1U6L5_9HELI|nr:conjugal transfer protein TraF [Helicobacter enhydrae]ANV98371.1 hypothetical protein BBW65_05970 [Helicobacter enhydrae]